MAKPKAISAYTHKAQSAHSEPDTEPGNYYVTCMNGTTCHFLLGPFKDNHAKALACVEEVKALAIEADPWAHFYSFGTSRADRDKPGSANKYLPHLIGGSDNG